MRQEKFRLVTEKSISLLFTKESGAEISETLGDDKSWVSEMD